MERVCRSDSIIEIQAYFGSLRHIKSSLSRMNNASLLSELYKWYVENFGISSWKNCATYCVLYGRTDNFRFFVEYSTLFTVTRQILEFKDKNGFSLLHHCSICNRHRLMRKLADKNVNFLDRVTESRSWFFSLGSVHPSTVLDMIKVGDTAFDICLKFGNLRSLKMLNKTLMNQIRNASLAKAFFSDDYNHVESIRLVLRKEKIAVAQLASNIVRYFRKKFNLAALLSPLEEEIKQIVHPNSCVSILFPPTNLTSMNSTLPKPSLALEEIKATLLQESDETILPLIKFWFMRHRSKRLVTIMQIAILQEDEQVLNSMLEYFRERYRYRLQSYRTHVKELLEMAILYSRNENVLAILLNQLLLDNENDNHLLILSMLELSARVKQSIPLSFFLKGRTISSIDLYATIETACKVGYNSGVKILVRDLLSNKFKLKATMLKLLVKVSIKKGYDHIATSLLTLCQEGLDIPTLINSIYIGTYPCLNFACKYVMPELIKFCRGFPLIDFNQRNLCDNRTCLHLVSNLQTLKAILGLSNQNELVNLDLNSVDRNQDTFLKQFLQQSMLQGELVSNYLEGRLRKLSTRDIVQGLELLKPYKMRLDFDIQCTINNQYFYPQWFVIRNKKILQAFIEGFSDRTNLNQRDSLGLTYYYRCLQLGWTSYVTLLHELAEQHEIDLNVADDDGWNAFLYCCRYNKVDFLREMLSYNLLIPLNVNVRVRSGQTGVLLAATFGYISVLRLLLEESYLEVDLSLTFNEKTAATIAKENGNTDCFKLLSKFGMSSHRNMPLPIPQVLKSETTTIMKQDTCAAQLYTEPQQIEDFL